MALPTLPIPTGVTYPMKKSPRFSSVTQTPVSGQRPVSYSAQQFPTWAWELEWEFIRDQGLEPQNYNNSKSKLLPDFFALQDFYLAMGGGNGRFIFDPNAVFCGALSVPLEDTYVTNIYTGTLVNGFSGIGNGTQTAFQLFRSSSITGQIQFVEAIDTFSAYTPPSVPPSPQIYVNGTLAAPSTYSLSTLPAVVTFNTAPANGAVISWSGYYAYCAQFSEDSIDFDQIMMQIWDLQSLKIDQVPTYQS